MLGWRWALAHRLSSTILHHSQLYGVRESRQEPGQFRWHHLVQYSSLHLTCPRVQAARDAADITILDDKFTSIVNAIKWGRNVFDNIRKFLQFQLTVNVVALTLTFVMACTVDGDVSKELPLNAVMLLWVNLIMDSLGALALATEKPTDALLDRPPHGKERLISVAMLRMTLSQSVFQLAILFFFSWGGSMLNQYCHGCNIWGNECCDENNWDADDTCMLRKNTIIFNTFVFCQFWNEINCRKIKELNVFEGYLPPLILSSSSPSP